MAKNDSGDERPSLEMPSLGFGRKKKKKKKAAREEEVPEQGPVADQWFESVREEPEPASPPPAREPAREPAPRPVATEVEAPPSDPDEPAPGARKARPQRSLPALGGMAASVVVGALVGLLTVGLTWASLRLCEVVQGTSSCGNPGFLLLLAIMVLMVVVGGALLRAFGVPDPTSTSFLGVGLVAVVALLFLVDLLFNWWMVLVIPAASVAAFALAHWVSTAFVEPAGRQMHR